MLHVQRTQAEYWLTPSVPPPHAARKKWVWNTSGLPATELCSPCAYLVQVSFCLYSRLMRDATSRSRDPPRSHPSR
eukprot:1582210-Rhodomonas_salina.2